MYLEHGLKNFCAKANKRGILIRAEGWKNFQQFLRGGGRQLGTYE